MKKLLSLLMSAIMLISTLVISPSFIFAGNTVKCGDNIFAEYDENAQSLTLKGSGKMYDYDASTSPWKDNSSYKIKTLVIGEGITTVGEWAFANMLQLESVSIPSTVTRIEERAFSGDLSMTGEIKIPASVDFIGTAAFRMSASRLTGFDVDEKNQKYCDIDGVLYDKAVTTLYYIPANNSMTRLEIPGTVKTIVDRAGEKNRNLKEVVIPESVTKLGNKVFINCDNLQKITFLNAALALPSEMELVTYPDKLTIEGYADSTAEKYAQAKKINFLAISVECSHDYPLTKTDFKKATVTEDGCTGNYVCSNCGEIMKKGSVIPKASGVKLSRKVITYAGSVQRPLVTITDSKDKSLEYRNDFTVSYSNYNSENAGEYEVTVKLTGGLYEGSKTYSYEIVPQSDVVPKVTKNTITRTGTVQRPLVTVKDKNGKDLVYKKDFTVDYSNWNSKEIGRYTVTVKMKGNYSGTKTYPYYINPKPTNFLSSSQGGFKSVSKGFKLTWKKQNQLTTGYQIQFATKKDFSNAASKWVANPNAVSTTITGRAGNKRYYVRIRTYRTINGKNFFSDWNSGSVKSVVTRR